jgi:3-isopropylmalate/(R)-2-methylmalate dehydratase small subunit
MQAFKNFTGIVAPLDRPNVDTDQIIPKQFLKAVVRSGLAAGLFYDWRNQSDNQFVLTQPRFEKATILAAGPNFGCGSSREHAVWSLADFGFKAVIAPSFADIFHNNCYKNGLLPITLKAEEVEAIFEAIKSNEDYRLSIDLQAQTVSSDDQSVKDGKKWSAHFEIDPFVKKCLLEGLDDIALTLAHEDAITSYEHAHPPTYK